MPLVYVSENDTCSNQLFNLKSNDFSGLYLLIYKQLPYCKKIKEICRDKFDDLSNS